MMNKIRFSHTNIIAKDWKSPACFYIEVFECAAINPKEILKEVYINYLTK